CARAELGGRNNGGLARAELHRCIEGRDAHIAVLAGARRLRVAGVRFCSPARGLGAAYLRRVRSPAAGPAVSAESGVLIGRAVAGSTRIGSTAAPASASTSSTLAPSGAKCRLPQASSASSTGRKSRPRAVSRYSSRGGFSL